MNQAGFLPLFDWTMIFDDQNVLKELMEMFMNGNKIRVLNNRREIQINIPCSFACESRAIFATKFFGELYVSAVHSTFFQVQRGLKECHFYLSIHKQCLRIRKGSIQS